MQTLVSPSPVLNSLRITLELIHNTYASAQKAGEEKTVLEWHSHKDNCSSFVRQDLIQYVWQQSQTKHSSAGFGKSNMDLISSNFLNHF